VQCHGVDGCPGESRFWWGVAARPMPVQEQLSGWWCRGRSSGRRPQAGSRVPLTGGRTRYSGWRSGVLSPHVPQRQVWWFSGRDGRTGPMAMEVTAPTGLTSRHRPARVQGSYALSLRGFCRPFSRARGAGRTGVGGTVPRAVADHAAQRRTAAGSRRSSGGA
jgi:hypothetical protein